MWKTAAAAAGTTDATRATLHKKKCLPGVRKVTEAKTSRKRRKVLHARSSGSTLGGPRSPALQREPSAMASPFLKREKRKQTGIHNATFSRRERRNFFLAFLRSDWAIAFCFLGFFASCNAPEKKKNEEKKKKKKQELFFKTLLATVSFF